MDKLSFEGLVVGSKEYIRTANRRYYHTHKEQEKARTKAWFAANPDKTKAWAEKNKSKRQAHSRKCEYSLLPERFDAMMTAQDGSCAICETPLIRPDVDHDHSCCKGRRSCGKCVRGILCHKCNTILGLAQDSTALLSTAIRYIETHKLKGPVDGNH